MDPLKSYLDYYKSLDAPGFAVLVTGDWGCGKSYQVKLALGEAERFYVSLFGISSEADVYGAVLAKMAPIRSLVRSSAKQVQGVSGSYNGIGGSVGGVLAGVTNAVVRDKVDKSRVLILDDLERCTVDLKNILGIINYYVEHHGCRVVVIAHDEMLHEMFKRAKEKIFGQSIKVIPRTQEAFVVFAKELSAPKRGFVETHQIALEQVFKASQCNSLRVLRHVLMDVGRLYEMFTSEQLRNKSAIQDVVKLFVAISIDMRMGELGREDIVGRIDKAMAIRFAGSRRSENEEAKSEEEKARQFSRSYQKYSPTVDISLPALGDEVLVSSLVDGVFEKSAFQRHFEESAFFKGPEDMPAWLRFMKFDFLDDATVESAVREMGEQIETLSFGEIGDFLHIVALQLLRSEEGLIPDNSDKVVELAKRCLDRLVDKGQFPLEIDENFLRDHGSFRGYGFWITEKSAAPFNEIVAYLEQCARNSLSKRESEIKKELTALLKIGSDELRSVLSFGEGYTSKYARIPVLNFFGVDEFATLYLGVPQSTWKELRSVLADRRGRTHAGGGIEAEASWFDAFDKELLERSQAAAGTIYSLRIRRRIPGK